MTNSNAKYVSVKPFTYDNVLRAYDLNLVTYATMKELIKNTPDYERYEE